MNKRILKLAAFAVLGTCGLLQANEPIQLAIEPISMGALAETADNEIYTTQAQSSLGLFSGLNVRGWVNAGVVANDTNPASRFNGPYNAVDRDRFMFNQLYLIAEDELPCHGIGMGGRVDLLFGEDYLLAQSIGFERRDDGSQHWNRDDYGLAFPQAYVSIGNQSASLQVGHFYSVVGYEGVMSPDNFFYTKSLSYQFAGPFTHWGAQLNLQPSDEWQIQIGLHNGWDALDRESDDVGLVGRIRRNFESGAWTSFAIATGKDFNNLAGIAPASIFTNRTRYSWLLSLPISCNVEYVFHQWLGLQQQGNAIGGQAEWYGIDQYLYYTINDYWRAGLRFEWFNDEHGTRVGLNRAANPNTPPFAGNFYSLSAGLNWHPNDYVTVRPEIRGDWFDGAGLPFGDGLDDSQFLFGIDAIVQF